MFLSRKLPKKYVKKLEESNDSLFIQAMISVYLNYCMQVSSLHQIVNIRNEQYQSPKITTTPRSIDINNFIYFVTN